MLSIIIPSHNTKKLLQECICSVVKETKDLDYEIIVVDNGSEYNIKNQIGQLADKHPKLKISLISNKRNLGFAKACNQGIKAAKGEYLLFLNSDTLILDKAINRAVKLIREEKKIDILGCRLINQDGSLQSSVGFFPKLRQVFWMMFFLDDLPILKKVIKAYHVQDKSFYAQEQQIDWVTGAFLLLKRKVTDKIEGFDEDFFIYAEEVDFCFRAKKAGFRVFYTPKAEVIHLKEASPREVDQKAILAEFRGLKLFFKKHKPSWERPILKFLLKIGALLRVFVFGILLFNEEKRTVYWRAFKMA